MELADLRAGAGTSRRAGRRASSDRAHAHPRERLELARARRRPRRPRRCGRSSSRPWWRRQRVARPRRESRAVASAAARRSSRACRAWRPPRRRPASRRRRAPATRGARPRPGRAPDRSRRPRHSRSRRSTVGRARSSITLFRLRCRCAIRAGAQARDLLPQCRRPSASSSGRVLLADGAPVDRCEHEDARARRAPTRSRAATRRARRRARRATRASASCSTALLRGRERGLVLDVAEREVAADRWSSTSASRCSRSIALTKTWRAVGGRRADRASRRGRGRPGASAPAPGSDRPRACAATSPASSSRAGVPSARFTSAPIGRAEREPADDVEREVRADVDARDRDQHRRRSRPPAEPGAGR